MAYFPRLRVQDINNRVQAALNKPEPRFTFIYAESTFGAWKNGYFPSNNLMFMELAGYSPSPFVWSDPYADISSADIIIVACGGAKRDLEVLADLREKVGGGPIIALWLFDNHTSGINNLNIAHAADFVFFSHGYISDYLYQPSSVNCHHIPAASVQWTNSQASEFFLALEHKNRKHKLLINYVTYPTSSDTRQRALAEYETSLHCADVFLMPCTDRSRYDRLSPKDRFQEWASYKGTVIVPVAHDLSTRVFDALLAGVIPIVPKDMPDFDKVIPLDVQASLGIVRVNSLDISEINLAAELVFSTFDSLGKEGCRARHQYVLANHMLVNRITEMLYILWLFGTKQAVAEFANAHAGPALYWKMVSGAA